MMSALFSLINDGMCSLIGQRNVALLRCRPMLVLSVLIGLLLALGGSGAAHAQRNLDTIPPITLPPPSTDAIPPPTEDPDPVPVDNAAVGSMSAPASMVANSTAYVTVTMLNSGNTNWSRTAKYPYRLGLINPLDSPIWKANRIDLVNDVASGSQVSFGFTITAPSTPGTYNFDWSMLREGLRWFGGVARRTITVTAPVYDAQPTSSTVPTTMTAGSTYNVALTFRNTGNVTWNRSEVYRIGTSSPYDNSNFGRNRVDLGVDSVAPGQSATFNFQVQAPATAGNYQFAWGMLWEHNFRFGQTSTTAVTVTAAATRPAISIQHAPAPVAGSAFTTYWTATNATSLSRVCTAAGTGYKVSETVPVNGSRSQVAQAAWVGYPSTCTWTASGAGGTTTYTETLTTSTGTTTKPVINVTRNPAPVAGQSFTTAWTTSNATSLTRVCTASGTGYKVNESLAVNGSRTDTALAAWVGYPSSCTWTANGAGGTTTHVETVTTTAAASGGVTYIHTDGLGSPVARTDASGQVINRTRYEPYGYVASGAAPSIGFTGHVSDADTGLTYMQQRYYDPVAGRFLSIDPVTTDANTGGSFNRYAYAVNSPYKYVDPDGRQERAAEAFGDQFRNDAASGNSGVYAPFHTPVVIATIGMVAGPPIAAAVISGTPAGATVAAGGVVAKGAQVAETVAVRTTQAGD